MSIGAKRKQKRFTTEKEILAEIQAQQDRIVNLTSIAEAKESQGVELCKSSDEKSVAAGRFEIAQSRKIRENSIPRVELNLEKLKNALSAYRTNLLPGIGGDLGVVLEAV